jgi:hypothetical protein
VLMGILLVSLTSYFWMHRSTSFQPIPSEAAPVNQTKRAQTAETIGDLSASKSTTPDATKGGRKQVAVDTPLPPPGIPLDEIFDALKVRADAGDARASCRLAEEFEFCAMMGRLKSDLLSLQMEDARPLSVRSDMSEEQVKSAAQSALLREEYSRKRQQELLDQTALIAKHCGRHTDKNLKFEQAQFRLQAAIAGHWPSANRYANDTSYLAQAAILRPDLVQAFRRYAPQFLEHGISTGRTNLQTVAAIYSTIVPSVGVSSASDWQRASVVPDQQRAHALALAAMQEEIANYDAMRTQIAAEKLQLVDPREHLAGLLLQTSQGLNEAQRALSLQQANALVAQRNRMKAELMSNISATTAHRLKTAQPRRGFGPPTAENCEIGLIEK